MAKHYSFFRLILICLFISISNSAFAVQTVYVGKKLDTLKIINKVKKLPTPPEQKLNYLINHGYIILRGQSLTIDNNFCCQL